LAAETLRGQPNRILVVDDHPDNIELLQVSLEAQGYIVESAADGQEALDCIYKAPPDLVLLDVMMPRIDGMEVARRIKNDPALPFIPIILQTALESTEDIVQGLDAGADDYITKPVNFRELGARVKSLLRIKTLQNDLAKRERQLSEVNERLLATARTDELTQLDNRRYLQERLHDMWRYGERLHEPLSIVMCDLDRFKQVNDRYGHQAGDVCLKEFATLLKSLARDIDRVGRYGGEEFLLLLPGTVLDAAVTFAERVRREMEQHIFTFEGGTIRRTMSCGVAAVPHPRITDEDALIKAADDALYVAKESGRNRVVRFDSREFNEHVATIEEEEEEESDIP
jgi:diguanylate cyclase (GGDEF)-like protein